INAAISSLVIPLKQKTEIRNLKSRHSRAGGNLGLSAQKLVGKNGFFRFYVLDSRFCGNDGRVVSVVSDKFCSPDKKYGCFGKKCRLKGFQTAFCF
ncbi:TPA: hypothetical protein ACFOA2_001931, partial [Neisseria meningitidis]